ncbi:MAG: peptidase M23 [Chitinophagaceae bacterium]|nr:MAG: peptidase M23 [Chitinophagaceae bacterium]
MSFLTNLDCHPVVLFDATTDKIVPLDLTASNTKLDAAIVGDTWLFSQYINNTLAAAGARYGIGGYNEHRTVYSRSTVFDSSDTGEEPRRLHLGTDIWGEAGTPVFAPLDGEVHSFAFNDQFGDYGATIILQHQVAGNIFYTLFGHLSLRDLEGLHAGKFIKAGNQFAHFGSPSENGEWPPHLHLQLILDIGGRAGDYPGVCRYSERSFWLKNSPDPDLILNLNKHVAKADKLPD